MSARHVAIVDTGGANLASLVHAFARIDTVAEVTADPEVIGNASHVVLPGVGAAGDAMGRIRAHELVRVLKSLHQPVLGICLGMHLLARRSIEQDSVCLGLLDTDVLAIPHAPGRPVPHMGWNQLAINRQDPLTHGLPERPYFYFVHTYAMAVDATTLASFDYGQAYAAVLRHGNYYGCQFHPERSARNGEILLRNFQELPA